MCLREKPIKLIGQAENYIRSPESKPEDIFPPHDKSD